MTVTLERGRNRSMRKTGPPIRRETKRFLVGEMVVPLTGIRSGDLCRVGGKAANLAVLTRAGLPVPPGFCVTTEAFDSFLEWSSQRSELLTLLSRSVGEGLAGARSLM